MYKVDKVSTGAISVIGFSDAGKAKSSLALTIPSTVTYSGVKCDVVYVGESAFKGATNITSVTFEYNPHHPPVFPSAFEGCTNLTFVNFPSSIGGIQTNAFSGCTKLKYVFIGLTNPDSQYFKWAFPSNTGMTLYVSLLGENTVNDYKNIDAFSVFSKIERSPNVYDFLFTDGAKMCVTKDPTTSVPGEVTMVAYNKNGSIAKDGEFVPACTSTSTGSYGANGYKYDFVDIADEACLNNTDLKSIDLSKLTKLKRVPARAFMGCTNLTHANINCPSLTEIGDQAFASTGIYSIYVPAGVTYCNYSFVDNCSNLQEIAVDEANTVYSSVNSMMFTKDRTILRVCPKGKLGVIREDDFPNEMQIVFLRAFNECAKLTEVYLPYGVFNLETEAFANCTSLKTVKVPSTVTKMGLKVFEGDTSLERLFFNLNNPLEIDDNAFTNAKKTTLYVPSASINKYKAANGWKDWTNIKSGSYDILRSDGDIASDTPQGAGYTVTSTNPQEVNGVKFDGRVRLTYHSDWGTELNLSDVVYHKGKFYNVYEVGMDIFADGKTDEFTLKLGKNVLAIRSSAFKDIDKLTKVSIGANVTAIYDNAFNGCSGLTEVEIEAVTPPQVMYDNAFSTYETTTLRVPKESLNAYKTLYVWPNFHNIKAIGEESLLGDVNNDGAVDITDANILINIILGYDDASNYDGRANVDGSGEVDIADANAVINIILGE